jgi:hypothetical protein
MAPVTFRLPRRPAAREVTVHVEVVAPQEAVTVAVPHELDLPPGTALRAVPLLAVLRAGDERLVAVGNTRILVDPGGRARVIAVVRALWVTAVADDTAGVVATGWRVAADHERLAELLGAAIRGTPHAASGDPEWMATEIAKALAEVSRNTVGDLRAFRYGLERLLGTSLRAGGSHRLEALLADVIELSTVCGRACDEAREAAQSGMWTWCTDPHAYHAHRRLMDPRLPARPGNRQGRRRPWFRVLDAGVRQCQAMERRASEEAPLLHSLLNAASTIAVTREARAQETFNLVATVGGVMLGIPALVLALYDASAVLPLRTSNAVVLVPLAAAGILAALLAAFLPGRERAGRGRRFAAALVAVVTTLVILVLAGTLVDPNDGVPRPNPAPSPSAAPTRTP